jgi:integrase/recombinase XerC
MFKNYLNYLRNERRYSSNTVTAYSLDLNQFADFLRIRYDIIELNIEVEAVHIRSWVISLIDAGVSARSVNRKLTAVKSFYKYLLAHKLITVNPASSLKGPKTAKKLPSFASEIDMVAIFDSVSFDDPFENDRNRLMVELFYATGIRLSELIDLTYEGVLFGQSAIKVIGKRNKERIVPIYPSLLESLQKYQLKYAAETSSNGFVFLTKKGAKLYPKLVYRVVNTYLSTARTTDKKSPHVIRHTFATHLLNNGAELNTIKELLGHTSLSATQVYTHNSIEKLKKIYQQAHPRA